MATIALIGAGQVGSQIAKLAIQNGNDVVLSNSRGPETLADLVNDLGVRARASTPVEAAKAGDIVIVALPVREQLNVPVGALAGKIVIDTGNYYPVRDGQIPELDNSSTTPSERLQAHLPKSKVVKAFNHIYAIALLTDGQPPGTLGRRALAIAGDDAAAKRVVAELIDQFGFDVLDLGPLSEGWRIDRNMPAYGPRRTREELKRDVAAARRRRERHTISPHM